MTGRAVSRGVTRRSGSATSCVAFLDEHAPPEVRSGLDFVDSGRRRAHRDHPAMGARLAGHAVRPRLDDPRLPARARRAERDAGPDARVPRGDGACAASRARCTSPATRSSRRPSSTSAPSEQKRPRPRRDPRRHGLVHRHERAERRLRPRGAPDARHARRRPLRHQRPEGLDELRDGRREVLLLRAHRSRRAEAQGHQPADRRHGHAGHRGAAAASHHRRRRLRRGVLHRRRGAGGEPRRGLERRLAHHAGLARARACGPLGGRRVAGSSRPSRSHRGSRATARPRPRRRRAPPHRRRSTSKRRRACARSATRASRRSRRARRRPSTRT